MKYIAVDGFGGDNAPDEIIKGCVAALGKLENSFGIIVTGREEAISGVLSANARSAGISPERLIVRNASEVVSNSDSPTAAIKEKKDSSMVVGLSLVRDGEADAFVSAGNTGALLTGALAITGRIKGVLRPALGVFLPSVSGRTFLIDAGANVDAKPEFLAQFAKMGSIYVQNVMGIASPRVGLINVGAEKEKGNALTKESYVLLEQSGLNFIGNVEARDIPLGMVDVAVCDAFVGNVLLKHSEGLSKALLSIIKKELMSGFASKLGAALSRGAFANLKKTFDPGEVGGAPFLGLSGLVVKAHGNSDANAIKNAIFQAESFIKTDSLGKIREAVGSDG